MFGLNYGEKITLTASPVLARALAGQNQFYPIFLTLFTVISMKMRNMSGVFTQILMTGSGYWQQFEGMAQRDNLLRLQERKQQHKRKSSKICSSNSGLKITSCCGEESQEHAACRKVCEKSNSRMESN